MGVKKRHTGSKSESFSDFHRTLDTRYYVIDIDWVELNRRMEPYLLYETVTCKNKPLDCWRWYLEKTDWFDKRIPVYLSFSEYVSEYPGVGVEPPSYFVFHNPECSEFVVKEMYDGIISDMRSGNDDGATWISGGWEFEMWLSSHREESTTPSGSIGRPAKEYNQRINEERMQEWKEERSEEYIEMWDDYMND